MFCIFVNCNVFQSHHWKRNRLQAGGLIEAGGKGMPGITEMVQISCTDASLPHSIHLIPRFPRNPLARNMWEGEGAVCVGCSRDSSWLGRKKVDDGGFVTNRKWMSEYLGGALHPNKIRVNGKLVKKVWVQIPVRGVNPPLLPTHLKVKCKTNSTLIYFFK